MRRAVLSAIIALIATMPTAIADQSSACGTGTFSCALRYISWVEVNITGDNLEAANSQFERFVRLRLKNDLSMIEHRSESRIAFLTRTSVLNPDGSFKPGMKFTEVEAAERDRMMRERGQVDCTIWTVGKSYPIASHVTCKLYPWTKGFIRNEFKQAVLGYSNLADLEDQVRDSLRMIIESISMDILETKDMFIRGASRQRGLE